MLICIGITTPPELSRNEKPERRRQNVLHKTKNPVDKTLYGREGSSND